MYVCLSVGAYDLALADLVFYLMLLCVNAFLNFPMQGKNWTPRGGGVCCKRDVGWQMPGVWFSPGQQPRWPSAGPRHRARLSFLMWPLVWSRCFPLSAGPETRERRKCGVGDDMKGKQAGRVSMRTLFLARWMWARAEWFVTCKRLLRSCGAGTRHESQTG